MAVSYVEVVNSSDSPWGIDTLTGVGTGECWVPAGVSMRISLPAGASGIVFQDPYGGVYYEGIGDGQQMGIMLYGDVVSGAYGYLVNYYPRTQLSYEHAEPFGLMDAGGPFTVGFFLGFVPTVFLGWPRKVRRLALLGMMGMLCLVVRPVCAQSIYGSFVSGGPSINVYIVDDYTFDIETNYLGHVVLYVVNGGLASGGLPASTAVSICYVTAYNTLGAEVWSYSASDTESMCQNFRVDCQGDGSGPLHNVPWIACYANTFSPVDIKPVTDALNPYGSTNVSATNAVFESNSVINAVSSTYRPFLTNAIYGVTNLIGTNGAWAGSVTGALGAVLGVGGTYGGVDLWVSPYVMHGTNFNLNPALASGVSWSVYASAVWWVSLIVATLEFIMLMTDEIGELLMWISTLPSSFPGREGLVSIVTWFGQVPVFVVAVLAVWGAFMYLVSSALDVVPYALASFGTVAGPQLAWAWNWMVDFCPVGEVLSMAATYYGWRLAGKPILIVVGGIVGRYLT